MRSVGGIESVGTVELEYVGRLLRMGYDSLVMSVCRLFGGGNPLLEQNELP